MDMDDKRNEFLTPETVGEMYVRWRLEEGLFADETLGTVRYVVDHSKERGLQADDFAREVGWLMMPYLASHPDIGFDSFRKSVRHGVKRHNLCIAFDKNIMAEPKEDEGVVYVWL